MLAHSWRPLAGHMYEMPKTWNLSHLWSIVYRMVHGFLTTNDDAFDAYFVIHHSFIHRIRTIG